MLASCLSFALAAVTAHLGSMHSAIKMLISRVALLHQMLLKMQSGQDV